MLRYLNYVTGLVRAVSVPVGYGLKFCFAQLRSFFIASLKIVSSSQCLHQTEALVASSFWLHDDTSGSIADPGLASLWNYHQKLNINGDPCWNKILFFVFFQSKPDLSAVRWQIWRTLNHFSDDFRNIKETLTPMKGWSQCVFPVRNYTQPEAIAKA